MNSALKVLHKAQMVLPDRRMFSPERVRRETGDYRALLNLFYFFQNSVKFFSKFSFFCFNFSGFRFFPVLIFLDSFLIIKLNCINQKACLINSNHGTNTI